MAANSFVHGSLVKKCPEIWVATPVVAATQKLAEIERGRGHRDVYPYNGTLTVLFCSSTTAIPDNLPLVFRDTPVRLRPGGRYPWFFLRVFDGILQGMEEAQNYSYLTIQLRWKEIDHRAVITWRNCESILNNGGFFLETLFIVIFVTSGLT